MSCRAAGVVRKEGKALLPQSNTWTTCLPVVPTSRPSRAPGAPLVEHHALSGLLLPARGEIWVNAHEAKQWPPRRRFTIGHELGHWVMHRAAGQQALFCRVNEAEAKARDI